MHRPHPEEAKGPQAHLSWKESLQPDPPSPPPTPTSNEKIVKVITTDGINRRSGPGMDYSIVGSYYYGDLVDVVEKSGDWYKDVDGYYLTADSNWVADAVGTCTATEGLNIRDGPGTNYSIIEDLNYGERVALLKRSNGWFYVLLSSGTKGWANGDWLSY